jgi:HlyD family secretion protein
MPNGNFYTFVYNNNIMQNQTFIQKTLSIIKNIPAWIKNTAVFLWKNHLKKTILGILVLLFIIWKLLSPAKVDPALAPHTVGRGDIRDQIELSGRTESLQDVNLGFADQGRVQNIYVSEGQRVKAGQVLATLEMGDLSAQMKSARAALTIARADAKNSDDTVERVTREQDSIVETARRNLYGSLAAYPNDTFTTLAAPIITGNYTGDIEGDYKLEVYGSNASTGASVILTGLESDTFSLTTGVAVPLGTRGLYIQFPVTTGVTAGSAYINTKWTVSIPNKRGASYSLLYNNYQTALASRDRAIAAARSATGDAMTSISAARIDQAEAQVSQIGAAMTRRQIRAPFSGTISKVTLKKGESTIGTAKDVSPGISMLATDNYKVVIKIPEIDVSRVVSGTAVNITLDAYGPDEVFKGTITTINPAETIVDGVPVYEGTVVFEKRDDRIRSGMTANVGILIGEKAGVIQVPAEYIKTDKVRRKQYIQIVDTENKNKTVEREITTGLRGSDGMTEVISGVSEGEVIKPFEKLKVDGK